MDASLWGTCHFWGRGDGPVAACRGPAHACRPRLCAQVALSKNQRAGLALRTKGVTLLSQRAHSGWARPRAPPRGQRWTGRPWNWSFPEWAWWGRASQFCRDLGSHRLCSFCGHRRARAGWVCFPHGSAEEAALKTMWKNVLQECRGMQLNMNYILRAPESLVMFPDKQQLLVKFF